MIVKNLTATNIFFGFYERLGKVLPANGTINIDDKYSLEPLFRKLFNEGKITVLSFGNGTLDIVIQQELQDSIDGVVVGGVERIHDQLIARSPGIGQYKTVYLYSNNYADTADYRFNAQMPVIGITKTSLASNVSGDIIYEGIIENTLWSLTPGDYIFAHESGNITQIFPTNFYSQRLGLALTDKKIYLKIEPMIKRG